MSYLHRQDVLLAVRLLNYNSKWTYESLGASIGMSASQCHSAFGRLICSALVDAHQKVPIKSNVLELLQHGVKYLFPAEPGLVVKGVPTAHSAPIWKDRLIAPPTMKFVWEHPRGRAKGSKIVPLYKSVPDLSLNDKWIYAILAVVDSIRLGKPRERNEASSILEDLVYGKL